jgi:hypothetical protein
MAQFDESISGLEVFTSSEVWEEENIFNSSQLTINYDGEYEEITLDLMCFNDSDLETESGTIAESECCFVTFTKHEFKQFALLVTKRVNLKMFINCSQYYVDELEPDEKEFKINFDDNDQSLNIDSWSNEHKAFEYCFSIKFSDEELLEFEKILNNILLII